MIFNKRLSLLLILGFIIALLIGSLSHEFAHFCVAKFLNYNSKMSLSFTTWENPATKKFIDFTYLKYRSEIDSGKYFPEKGKYIAVKKQLAKDNFWIILAGPFLTILTGSIGFVLLVSRGNSFYAKQKLLFRQWLLIFLSLFWLRQAINFSLLIGKYILAGEYYNNADELKLSHYLKLPDWTLISFTGVIGIVISYIVIFRYIPITYRFTFIVSGCTVGVIALIFF